VAARPSLRSDTHAPPYTHSCTHRVHTCSHVHTRTHARSHIGDAWRCARSINTRTHSHTRTAPTPCRRSGAAKCAAAGASLGPRRVPATHVMVPSAPPCGARVALCTDPSRARTPTRCPCPFSSLATSACSAGVPQPSFQTLSNTTKQARKCTHAHARTHAHTHTHTRAHAHKHTHACMHMRAHAHSDTHPCARAHPCTGAHARRCALSAKAHEGRLFLVDSLQPTPVNALPPDAHASSSNSSNGPGGLGQGSTKSVVKTKFTMAQIQALLKVSRSSICGLLPESVCV